MKRVETATDVTEFATIERILTKKDQPNKPYPDKELSYVWHGQTPYMKVTLQLVEQGYISELPWPLKCVDAEFDFDSADEYGLWLIYKRMDR